MYDFLALDTNLNFCISSFPQSKTADQFLKTAVDCMSCQRVQPHVGIPVHPSGSVGCAQDPQGALHSTGRILSLTDMVCALYGSESYLQLTLWPLSLFHFILLMGKSIKLIIFQVNHLEIDSSHDLKFSFKTMELLTCLLDIGLCPIYCFVLHWRQQKRDY